ncbi:MAG: exosortase family protein XrtM [Methylococcales bacterium]|nr:exosortase family protein XrtM [Methylococcales bacterium]
MSDPFTSLPTIGPADWGRLFLFAGCYWLLNYLYFLIPNQTFIDVVYHYGVVRECADLINAILPHERVAAVRNHLLSARADLEIVRGCDSAGVLFLFASAVLAFPARLPKKLVGLVCGAAWIYVLNLVRVIGLYFLMQGRRDWFEYAHVYFAPTLMTLGAVMFFIAWAVGSPPQNIGRNAAKAVAD